MSAEMPGPTGGLVGRQAELGAVGRFIEGLAGRSSELPIGILIEGPAGIGKTALWLAAVEAARQRGVTILAARPAEVEAGFAYAALADLLRDVLGDLVPPLPARQRSSIRTALGLSDDLAPDSSAVDGHLVQSAVANGIVAAAASAPVLIAIDDCAWLDAPTAAVLEFLARRVGDRPIGFLVAQRTEERSPAPLGLDAAVPGRPVDRVWLEPLSLGALHLLLAERLDMTLPRPHLIRLHELSRGNPFHALEIARALRGRPLPPAGDRLPIPASLRELLVARSRGLPAGARELLLLVAAAGTIRFETVSSLFSGDAGVAAEVVLATCVDEALLSVERDVVRAAHPLIASSVYEAATHAQRRAAHRRLANVSTDAEERARHRALAIAAPNEEVARELETAAELVRKRGAPDTAAGLYRLARELTPGGDEGGWARRSVALAEALLGAADLTATREVLDEVIPRLGGRDLARAQLLRSEVEWYTGTAPVAVGHLLAALAAADGHPNLEAEAHYRLSVFYDYDAVRALEHAQSAVSLLEGANRPSLLASSMAVLFSCEVWAGMAPRTDLLDRALAMEPADTPDASTIPGIWWLALGRSDDARRRFRTMLERDRRRGDLSSEADLLTKLSDVALYEDDYGTARDLADAATAAARQQGSEAADPARRVRALVDVHEGRLAEAKAIAGPAARRAADTGDHVIAVAWLVVLVLAAVSEGDHAAVERLAAQSEAHLEEIGGVEALRLSVRHERPEALVGLSRLDEAATVLAALEGQEARIPRPWLQAAIVRGRALLLAARGELSAAADSIDAAMADGASGWRRFDRARTLLVRGHILRRARARREAAAVLDEAKRIFEEIGAPVWAARAAAEAERLGRSRAGTEDLTPTELQVATLAASGLTNREVAEQLSISPKTVEAHLARSYAKLGIRSRAELGRLMAARGPTGG